MNSHPKKTLFPLWALAVLFSGALACGGGGTGPPQVIQGTNPAQEAPASPTNTPMPTAIPPTATPPPIGLSRSIPYPLSDIVSAPNWDVQVVEVKRGEDAWKDIQAANMFNEPAPEGMEYLLVRLHVKSTYSDSDEHSISGCDFDMTGDRLIRYTCSMASVVEPDPELDATLFSGGEAEGWAGFVVGQGEGNLILAVNESFNFDENTVRYIALDQAASLSIPSDLAGITPTDLGTERSNPAPRSDRIVTEDWIISVIDVIRGDVAWQMVQEANQFNDPPPEGMEYIAAKIHARYFGTEDTAVSIDGSFFSTTGSANVIYDLPSVVDPEPSLDISLYPGGEYDGWVVLQAAKEEAGVMLIFEPLFDFTDENRRFISLEP